MPRLLLVGICAFVLFPFLVSASPRQRVLAQTDSDPGVVEALQPQFTTPGGVGVGDYTGGTNTGLSFQLPLVRTDTSGSTSYDTIIHTANATASSLNVSITFYNQNGTTLTTVTNNNLAAWASWDYDVGQQLNNSSFSGSAVVTSNVAGIAVAADVISSTSGATDNLDTYAGIPSGATLGYFPLAYNADNYFTSFYVRNPNSSSANVTLTFFQDGIQKTVNGPVTVPALGSVILQPNNTSFQAGPVQVSSSQGVAVVAETSKTGAFYTLSTMAAPSTATTFYLPRFEYNTDTTTNLTSNLLVLNTTPSSCTSDCNARYTVQFYDSNGNLVSTVTSSTNGVKPMRDWPLGSLTALSDNQVPTGLTSGSVYSAVLSNPNGVPIVPLVATLEGSFSSKTSISVTDGTNYNPITSSPSGSWGYLPGLRKSVAGESTGFTFMNIQSTPQDYQITYWGQGGNLVRTDTLSLLPNQAWYADQATDAGVPAGAPFSAQVIDISAGGIPPTLIQLYAGTDVPPTPQSASSPTPFPTLTPTPSPTPTDTATETVTLSPTGTPSSTDTPSATSSPTTTPSPTNSSTDTPTITATATPSPSLTPSLTDTPSSTSSPSTTTTPSPSPISTSVSGTPVGVVTTIGDTTVSVSIPAADALVSQLLFTTPSATPAITPLSGQYQIVLSFEVSASNLSGNQVHLLSAPLELSVRFTPPGGANAPFAQMYTVDLSGNAEELPTSVTSNGDGTFTASFGTDHLSPFVLYAPGIGTAVPRIYVPITLVSDSGGW